MYATRTNLIQDFQNFAQPLSQSRICSFIFDFLSMHILLYSHLISGPTSMLIIKLLALIFKNSSRDVPSNNMTSHGRRMSAGRPSLNGINQLPVVQDSTFTTPKSSPYLTAVDARDVMSKSSGSTDASSQDCLHNLISVGGQTGISGVTEEARKAVEKCHLWEFDVIQLETITNHRYV